MQSAMAHDNAQLLDDLETELGLLAARWRGATDPQEAERIVHHYQILLRSMFALGYHNWLDVESELPDRFMPDEYLSDAFLENPSKSGNLSAPTDNPPVDHFLRMAAYSLRAPLTMIKGYTDLLMTGEEGELNESQAEMLQQIDKTTEQIGTLINELFASSQPLSDQSPSPHERNSNQDT